MGSVSTAAQEKSKNATEPCFGRQRTERRFLYELMQKARGLWPRKTAAELSLRTNVSQRAAEFWLACDHDLSLDAARALIRSEEGIHFLEIFMGDARPQWWIDAKQGRQIAILRREQADHKERLEQFELEIGRSLKR